MRKITRKLISNFKTDLNEGEKSENTVEKYIRDITFSMLWLNDREVTKILTLEYKKRLCEKYAPNSVNSIISALNNFFAFMQWHDMHIKALKIQRHIFSIREKELTKTEYEKLLCAAKSKKNERLYLLMQTICSTGIRVLDL